MSMAESSIERIWEGGIHDHLGGGIARYATDRRCVAALREDALTTRRFCYVLSEYQNERAIRSAGADDLRIRPP